MLPFIFKKHKIIWICFGNPDFNENLSMKSKPSEILRMKPWIKVLFFFPFPSKTLIIGSSQQSVRYHMENVNNYVIKSQYWTSWCHEQTRPKFSWYIFTPIIFQQRGKGTNVKVIDFFESNIILVLFSTFFVLDR
jgi:hypothetical protein